MGKKSVKLTTAVTAAVLLSSSVMAQDVATAADAGQIDGQEDKQVKGTAEKKKAAPASLDEAKENLNMAKEQEEKTASEEKQASEAYEAAKKEESEAAQAAAEAVAKAEEAKKEAEQAFQEAVAEAEKAEAKAQDTFDQKQVEQMQAAVNTQEKSQAYTDSQELSKEAQEYLEEVQEKVTVTEEEVQQKRSEEHTSELQSRFDLVCRLLLEKKKKNKTHVPVVSA